MTGTLIVSSRSTSIKSIVLSARQAKHCMTAAVSLPAQTGARPSDALCVSFEEVPARVASRQAAPPCLVFNSAVRTLEQHWLAPDAGQGRVINVKVKINRL